MIYGHGRRICAFVLVRDFGGVEVVPVPEIHEKNLLATNDKHTIRVRLTNGATRASVGSSRLKPELTQ